MLKVVPRVALSDDICPTPIEPTDFTESRTFSWNVENAISRTMNFKYYVGEGPLYWFRVDWYPTPCPPNPCVSTTPMIDYIAPNCPYDIIDSCVFLPPMCTASPPPCPNVEVWHMLATSVQHLCERINQECCNRIPTGYMRKVKQYMRPALCCDVQAIGPGSDVYVDVDFFKCECGNLIDPSLAYVVYPCHVNRCGINGPAFSGGVVPPISTIKFAPDILNYAPVPIAEEVSTAPVDLQVIPPTKEAQPVNKVFNRLGPAIPEILHCKHNLAETSNLGDYLKISKTKFNSIDLFHNKEHNLWRGSQTMKDWKVATEWTPTEDGYKFNLLVEKGKKATKISLTVKTKTMLDSKGTFMLDFSLNVGAGTLISKDTILQSKTINDGLGLFNSRKKLDFNLKG